MLIQAQELQEYVARDGKARSCSNRALVEAQPRSPISWSSFDDLVRDASQGGRPLDAVEHMRAQVKQIQQAMLRQI